MTLCFGSLIDISNHFLAFCKHFVCCFSKSFDIHHLVNFHMNFDSLMMSAWYLENGHPQKCMPSTALHMHVWWQRLGIMHAISLESSECDFSVKEGPTTLQALQTFKSQSAFCREALSSYAVSRSSKSSAIALTQTLPSPHSEREAADSLYPHYT